MSESIPIGETSPSPSLQFNISRLVEVPHDVEVATQSAITAVWDRHVGTPASVNVIFKDSISLELPNGDTASLSGLYVPATDTISLALGTLGVRHPGLTLAQACVMYAGHEARHKVQTALGDAPPETGPQMIDGTYANSRHEVEAWQSSLQAYISTYPGQPLSFKMGRHGYSTF